MTDDVTNSAARAVIEKILYEYMNTLSGGMSRLMERELVVPVTLTDKNTYVFSGFHYIDVSIDDFLEGIPVSFTASVSASRHGGYELSLVCQTNLDEPDYAYWEFRDFFKRLMDGGYLGSFTMHEFRLSDEDCGDALHYEYKFPVPDDGDVSAGMIACVVSRFLIDVSHAAGTYFQLFFYHLPSHHTPGCRAVPAQAQCPEGDRPSKVIPFPINRRNKAFGNK
jgi:hypothetical protein